MKPKSNYRSRHWSLTTYSTPQEFSPLLSLCSEYSYIYHNKEESEPHYHILCIFKNAKTFTAVRSYIQGSQNTFGEPARDLNALYRYLTHKDNPDKHQYEDTEIIASNPFYWLQIANQESFAKDGEKALNLLEDINAKKSYRYMVLTYGRDYIKNHVVYEEMAFKLFIQEQDEEKNKQQIYDIF
ncbi:MAG: replication protein [Inoviridae sp.]|nr:MAG: replication protein [Inoviridae sp.]